MLGGLTNCDWRRLPRQLHMPSIQMPIPFSYCGLRKSWTFSETLCHFSDRRIANLTRYNCWTALQLRCR
jgi:hypothetical protein